MSFLQEGLVWAIAGLTIAGVVLRPWHSREWMWAVGGAACLVLVGAIAPTQAATAIAGGANVYAFLIGVMALAAVAHREHVFHWAADAILHFGGGSRARLFGWIYGLGVAITALLSNDATVIVLTPAIFAVVRGTGVDPLPYLFACALVANVASFALPISNPANLLVFGHALPTLQGWLAAFGFASVAAVLVSFVAIRWWFRVELRGDYVVPSTRFVLRPHGRLALWLTVSGALALVCAAAVGLSVGLVALVAGCVAVGIVTMFDRFALRFVVTNVSWQILPLLAGLFIVVASIERVGGLVDIARFFSAASHAGGELGTLAIGSVTTLACGLFNNLPVALAGSSAVTAGSISPGAGHAMMVAIDLGTNVTPSASLATLLWLIILRSHGVVVKPLQFLRIGIFVTVPTLVAALLLVR